VVGSGARGAETDLSCFAAFHVERRAGRAAALAKTVDSHRRRQVVPDRRNDFGTCRDPDERRRHRERLADLAERLDSKGRTAIAFGSPQTDAHPQREHQHTAFEITGRTAVVVRDDGG
jgi:hypothetical protein